MHLDEIHQIAPTISAGDGVSNVIFLMQRLLREIGVRSDIYVRSAQAAVANRVRSISEFQATANTCLLHHHCFGTDHPGQLLKLHNKKVLVYHNITPADLCAPKDRASAILGRKQLASWRYQFQGAIGLSAINTLELEACHYKNITTIPFTGDVLNIKNAPYRVPKISKRKDMINLLFVGRICRHKCQHDVIKIAAALGKLTDKTVQLFLVGGCSEEPYLLQLRQQIKQYSLSRQVHLLGKVANADLYGLYRYCDFFVSMSEHEGFGIPLIEASVFGLPVIAYNSSNIAATLGTGGLIVNDKHHRLIAATILALDKNPQHLAPIIAAQTENLQRFDHGHLRSQLSDYMLKLWPLMEKEARSGYNVPSLLQETSG